MEFISTASRQNISFKHDFMSKLQRNSRESRRPKRIWQIGRMTFLGLALALAFRSRPYCVPDRPFRLHTPNQNADRVQLTSLHVDVLVLENLAQMAFEFVYRNTGDVAVEEAKLLFPYDSAFAVSDVVLESGGKILKSQAVEINEAYQQYQEHKQQNETALFVRREGDFLGINLAIIPPRTEMAVRLTAVTVLDTKFNIKPERWSSHFVLPLSLVRQYTPLSQDPRELRVPSGSSSVSYQFSFSFEAPFASSVSSVSHPNATEPKKLSYNGILTQDLAVDVEYDCVPRPIIERFEDSQVTQFTIDGMKFPRTRLHNASIVFIVDRSGSMQGSPIHHVRRALSVFLHSLPLGCRFEIVSFGFHHEALFRGLTEYTDATMGTASDYIDRMDADMGGTEILAPLQYVLGSLKPEVVFLLTDGAVSNTQDVLETARRCESRISTFGIGNGASVGLVRGLAELTGGQHEFMDDDSRIEEAVARSLSDSLRVGISNVVSESSCGRPLQNMPRSLPGNSLTTFRFYSNHSIDTCDFRLKGDNFDKVFTLAQGHFVSSKMLHAYSVVAASNRDVLNKEETLAFARRLNLMTQHTGLLLYDGAKYNGPIQSGQISVPILVRDHGFAPGNLRFAAQRRGLAAREKGFAAPQIAFAAAPEPFTAPPEAMAVPRAMDQPENAEMDLGDTRKGRREMDDAIKDPAIEIIKQQTASGAWEDPAAVCRVTGKNAEWSGRDPKVAATALAIAYLKGCGLATYERIVAKGLEWLERELGQHKAEEVMNWAEKF
jgi:hypothetical protein